MSYAERLVRDLMQKATSIDGWCSSCEQIDKHQDWCPWVLLRAELTRLRAIEKAARVVAKNWTVEDCSPNMRLVWRFEHESLRAFLREKGADCGCPERDRTDERPHPPTQNSVRGDPGKFETEPEVDEGAWIVVTLVLVPVFVIALFALLRVASR